MKTLIIFYISVHHKNTEKVAKAMAEELGADIVAIGQAQPETLTAYDLIGFGSGIFYGKFYKTLLQFAEGLPTGTGERAFIFSTSGDGKIENHAAFKELLVSRRFSVVGDFSCKAWDTWGPLKLFGGINKGRPNEEDLEEARVFARGLKEKYI
ncbi:MAG: flavodoxin family protein [Halobacteriota archaeon]